MDKEQKHSRFEVLDGMRGVAAIAVMLHHYAMFSDFNVGASPFLGNATAAVDLFFMLSGFVLLHSYAGRLQAGMPASDYLKKRVVRLYPFFLISLIIGYLSLYAFTLIGRTDFTVKSIMSGFAVNALFLPYPNTNHISTLQKEILPVIFPSNDALWSLFFEMVASIAFLWLYKRSTAALSVIAALSMVVLTWLAVSFYGNFLTAGPRWFNFIGGFPRVFYGFIAGMVIYRLTGRLRAEHSHRFDWIPAKSALIYAAMFLCLAFPMHLKGGYAFLQMTVFAPILVTVGSLTPPQSRRDGQIAEFLGWLSYPLYCLHMPVFRLVEFVNERYGLGATPGLLSVESIAATLILSVILTLAYDEPVRRFLGQPSPVHVTEAA